MTSAESRAIGRPLLWVALGVFLIAFLRTAWVSDDAYITFRTIDNFLNGYGLRWNIVERVQSYTHPLWLLVLIPFHWASGEAYFSTVLVSIALSLLTIRALARVASSGDTAVVVLIVLLFSRAFIDYSTSGLENPLTGVLLVLFLGHALRTRPSMGRLSLLGGLLLLTRLDLAVLILPVLAAALIRSGTWRHRGLVAGFLPLAAWEVFSLGYYGFPFPNTAYAKLKTGIPASELWQQGVIYLVDAVQRDPVTPLVIMAALALAWAGPARRAWPVALGIVLQLLYVVSVGGDFMSGRFLVAPLVAACVMIATADWPALAGPRWAPAAILVAAFAALAPNPMPQRAEQTLRPRLIDDTGIADERLAYFPTSGLPYYARGVAWPRETERWREARQNRVPYLVFCCVGMMGYFAGPDVFVVDEVGLADPLLARLPARAPWRIGHFMRDVPPGYVESIESGRNDVRDPGVAAYYEHLRTITREPLLSGARLRTILRMNLGRYESLLAPYAAANRMPR